MSTSSNPATPRQLEVDAVVDLLDKFYSEVWEEGGSIEEQEDVNLYNLYDRCSPQPCLKSPPPNPKPDSSPNEPIDQEMLAKKLWNYMESTSHSNTPNSKCAPHGSSGPKGKGPSAPVGASERENGGAIAPTSESLKSLHKN